MVSHRVEMNYRTMGCWCHLVLVLSHRHPPVPPEEIQSCTSYPGSLLESPTWWCWWHWFSLVGSSWYRGETALLSFYGMLELLAFYPKVKLSHPVEMHWYSLQRDNFPQLKTKGCDHWAVKLTLRLPRIVAAEGLESWWCMNWDASSALFPGVTGCFGSFSNNHRSFPFHCAVSMSNQSQFLLMSPLCNPLVVGEYIPEDGCSPHALLLSSDMDKNILFSETIMKKTIIWGARHLVFNSIWTNSSFSSDWKRCEWVQGGLFWPYSCCD